MSVGQDGEQAVDPHSGLPRSTPQSLERPGPAVIGRT